MAGQVTVSIDDGVKQDLRTAELLDRHRLRATFYVPAKEPRELTPAELRSLSARFEIGAHSFSHIDLTSVPPEEARRELREGKAWLEQVIGREVDGVAYPFGRFNDEVARLAAEEAYTFARTCLLNRTDVPGDPHRVPITTDAVEHLRRVQIRHALRERNYRGLGNYVLIYRLKRDWEAHFHQALELVKRRGGVAHLVVHSAQIEERGAWDKLDRVLRAAAGAGLQPVTNAEAASAAR